MTELSYDIKVSLFHVQQNLKAPKDLNNSFGGYKYRSAESILEAVKPLLKDELLVLIISDKMVNFGDRYYIQATVTVSDTHNNSISTTALAREAEAKKGMDEAQITGAASSYARKYALNGMFAIDDTKDPDTDEHTAQRQRATAPKVTRDRVAEVKAGSEPFGESADTVLVRAKKAINEQLEAQDYTRPDSKKAFIKGVLGKEIIDNLNDCDAVADALDNEKPIE